MSVTLCPPNISRTVYLIYFKLERCIAGAEKMCSVEFDAIWTHDMFNTNYFDHPIKQLTLQWGWGTI